MATLYALTGSFDRPKGNVLLPALAAASRFYVCAADAMMNEVTEALTIRGVPASEVFKERFGAPIPLLSQASPHVRSISPVPVKP